MRTSVVGMVVVAVMVSAGGEAVAEEPKPVASTSGVFAPERSGRRDSIWNGGLIGAAIGGVGGSALIVASRGGSDNIGRAMLNVCVPPALAGFAVGAIVDALH